MRKFLCLLNRKATIGNTLTIIASLAFAVIVRYIYHYSLDYIAIRGELGMLDLGYFSILVLLKCLFSARLEYLLDDKFSIPLFAGTVKEPVDKRIIVLNMVDKNAKQPSAGSSSGAGDTRSADMEEIGRIISEMVEREKPNPSSIAANKHYEIGTKMWSVLMEQEKKLLRLHDIKTFKHIEFYEEDGGLEITVPATVGENEAKALSKEIGGIDISLQNKFSEYSN